MLAYKPSRKFNPYNSDREIFLVLMTILIKMIKPLLINQTDKRIVTYHY